MSSVLQALAWPWHHRALTRMTDLNQFRVYVNQARARKFMAYQASSSHKRAEFLSVLDAIHLDPQNLNCLDLGPGYGDSLDVCHERGGQLRFLYRDRSIFLHLQSPEKIHNRVSSQPSFQAAPPPPQSFQPHLVQRVGRCRPRYSFREIAHPNVAVCQVAGATRKARSGQRTYRDLPALEERRYAAPRPERERLPSLSHDVRPRL